MLHTFVSLVDDKPGVLTRVASLFRRLNVNIVSLTVGESEREGVSRMTIVCDAPEHAADRVRASLYKLEIVRDVDELGRSEAVIRELCLIKVAAGPNSPHGCSLWTAWPPTRRCTSCIATRTVRTARPRPAIACRRCPNGWTNRRSTPGWRRRG